MLYPDFGALRPSWTQEIRSTTEPPDLPAAPGPFALFP